MLAAVVVVPVILISVSPRLAYVAFLGYTLYWAMRSLELAVRQSIEFATLRRYRQIRWDRRLRRLTDPYERLHALASAPRLTGVEAEELAALRAWVRSGPEVPPPDELYHLVVMPVANESIALVRQSLDALLATDYPPERLLVCLSVEARSRRWSADDLDRLAQRYRSSFGMFVTTRHPDGLPGEQRVKGANISWGARLARAELHRRGLRDEQVVVSAFDCDTRPSRHYFQVLSYTYLTNPTRDIDSYQPVLLFHNNVWDVPAVSRLVGYVASMWTMVDSTRPRWLRIFSSHAMGMKALVAVDFWSKAVIPDDSRQFWRMYFHSDGRARTRPLHVPVYLDAVHAGSYRATLREQYRQIRRWSYGVIDFPYVVEQSLANPRIPVLPKLVHGTRQLAQFHLWATVPVVLLVLRPLLTVLEPVALGTSPGLLGEVVPVISAAIAVCTTAGLIASVAVASALLPDRPPHRSRWYQVRLPLEWLLLPVVLPVFLCLPAIDAQLRLLGARYLGFRVTAKHRRNLGHRVG